MTSHPESAELGELKRRLAECELRHQVLLDASLDCIICADKATKITEFNAAAERAFRTARADVLGRDIVELILPVEARDWHRQNLFNPVNSTKVDLVSERIETTAMRPDGTKFPCELTVTRNFPQEPMFVVHLRDITAHKRSEEAMIWLAAIVESSDDAIIGKDLDGKIISWNKGAEAMYGYTAEEVIGRHISVLVPDGYSDEIPKIMQQVKQGQRIKGLETVRKSKNGSLLNVWLTISPVQATDGSLVGASAIARDITSEKLAQEALRTARDTSVYSSPVPIVAADVNGAVTVWNPAAAQVFGWSEKEVLGKPLPIIPLDDMQEADRMHQRLLSGEILTGIEVRRQKRDGACITVSLSASPLFDQNKKVKGMIGFLTDISARKQAEEAWRRAEEKYRSIFENAEEGIYQVTPEGKYISANPALAHMLGFESPQALIDNRNQAERPRHVNPERLSGFLRSIEEHGSVRNFEFEIRRQDGKMIWISTSAHAVRDGNGRLLHFEGTVQDVTEPRELEHQLRHVQKMEAVGRLAGGVAHDFNNILMAISSYSELLSKLTKEESTKRYTDEIMKAVSRGSSVTQGLLTFSRKQVSSPKVIDINEVIAEQLDMLKRLIPESIDLSFLPADSACHVTADPTQIEQIVMNLVINARDAMPYGGRIGIETATDNAGEKTGGASHDHVVLKVRDNGSGMDADTKSHLFEPFYTTKEVGKGTGLGLATVFGIVKQSMGHIAVQSEVNQGTTFTITLPRVEGTAEAASATEIVEDAGNGETILLVEDEAAVRDPAAEYLVACGYNVLTAASGLTALKLAKQRKEPIDLLLTDLVMPGMSGRELAEKISDLHSETKIVFMSGYSNNVLSSHQLLDSRHVLLQKPVQLKVLSNCIRRILNRKNAARA
ncbi:MAG TPA: PAS domain S-box protein [Terriglobales bacterium]|nr:PAS domain S-box protein [Terriglobales bacterium]